MFTSRQLETSKTINLAAIASSFVWPCHLGDIPGATSICANIFEAVASSLCATEGQLLVPRQKPAYALCHVLESDFILI